MPHAPAGAGRRLEVDTLAPIFPGIVAALACPLEPRTTVRCNYCPNFEIIVR